MVALGTIVAFLVLAVIVVMAVMSSSIKIITPYEQGIYMRMGRYIRVLNQGVNFVTPLISQVVRIDLRTQVIDIPGTQIASKDNRRLSARAIIYVKVIDPMKAYFQVTNYRSAIVYLAQSIIKDVLGGMDWNEISTSRNVLDMRLKDKLDEAADKWGLLVERLELRDVYEDAVPGSLEPFAQYPARMQEHANDARMSPREASRTNQWR